jgi:hypothetical protein
MAAIEQRFRTALDRTARSRYRLACDEAASVRRSAGR